MGIVVGSVTSPTFGMEALGQALFYGGFVCYLALLVIVTLRYAKLGVPEGARPLFCIYAAPMSLSLAGYLTVTPEPNLAFALVLAVLAQALFALVLVRLPKLLKLPFYPSYAAMTFPFVITAIALGKVLNLAAANGFAVPAAFEVLVAAETLFATVMVLDVAARYLGYFYKLWAAGRPPPSWPSSLQPAVPSSWRGRLPVPESFPRGKKTNPGRGRGNIADNDILFQRIHTLPAILLASPHMKYHFISTLHALEPDLSFPASRLFIPPHVSTNTWRLPSYSARSQPNATSWFRSERAVVRATSNRSL